MMGGKSPAWAAAAGTGSKPFLPLRATLAMRSATAAPVRQAAVELLLQLQQLSGGQRLVERWLSQQRLPQALQEDLERMVRTRPASSPSSRPPGSAASRADHLLGSSSRAGLVPPRTAGL